MTLFPPAKPPPNPSRKTPGKPSRLPPVKGVHMFVDSGTADVHNRRVCGADNCGSIEQARVHQLPDTPPDAAELDERRLGETG